MPDWRLEIQRRLADTHLRPEREAEIVDELVQHLEDRYRASLAAGRSSDESEARAWRELEAHEVLGRELARVEAPAPVNLASAEVPRRGFPLRSLWQDLRYGARALRQRPLLTLTVLITVGLSLGPAIAVTALTDALFFRPLPGIADPSRLLTFQFGRTSARGFGPHFVSYANLADIVTGATTVTALTGQQLVPVAIAADGAAPRLVSGQSVMANYFDLLGVKFASGRGFRREEDSGPGGEPVVVLNDTLAHELFPGGAPIGRVVHLNSLAFEVIGVTADEFQGTLGAFGVAKVWVTGMAYLRLVHAPPDRWAYATNQGPFYEFIVRSAPGAAPAQVAAELAARTQALADREPVANDIFTTIAPKMMPGFGAPLSLDPTATGVVALLLAVAGVLVLLGMANVANLLIFQGLATGREIAIRKALGASARRILQLRLVQSLLLSFVGAVAGIGVADVLGGLLGTFGSPGLEMNLVFSWRVATVAALLALVVGVGFGIAPACLAARASLTAALARGLNTNMPRAALLRHGLTVVQLALSLTLLLGALLFLVTLRHLRAVDLGLDVSHVTTRRVDLRSHGYTGAQALDYYHRFIDSVRQAPGIDSVAVSGALPLLGGAFFGRVYESGRDPSQMKNIVFNAVSAGYFRVLGVSLLCGRVFADDEALGTTGAADTPVVVSETLAQRVFGSSDVIGRRLTTPKTMVSAAHDLEIVGVVREEHWLGVLQPADPILYEPIGRTDSPITSASVLVRSPLGPATVARLLQGSATAIDPAIPLHPEQTMNELIDRQLGQQRLFAWVLGVLAVVGFALAAAGLYGLVAQGVSERAREFGIRMAVGADRTRILGLVLRQAAAVAATGTVVGLGLGWMSGRAIESQLFGVRSHDPMIFAASAGLLAMVVLVASLGPARAATRVNPVDALRSE
jgi:predicted permease